MAEIKTRNIVFHWNRASKSFMVNSKAQKEEMEKLLGKMLHLIRKNPGIRPRELHRILGLEHSASLRNTLIKRGLVRKERRGVATYYYSIRQPK